MICHLINTIMQIMTSSLKLKVLLLLVVSQLIMKKLTTLVKLLLLELLKLSELPLHELLHLLITTWGKLLPLNSVYTYKQAIRLPLHDRRKQKR